MDQTNSPHSDAEKLLTESEAAQILGLTPRALQSWRLGGYGPRHVKISSRAIRYRRCDLTAWIEGHVKEGRTAAEGGDAARDGARGFHRLSTSRRWPR